MAVPDAVNALVNLTGALLEDVEVARQLMGVLPLGFARRQYVRAVFALLDGTIFGMKQSAYEAADGFSIVWNASELAIIREEAYDLDDRGSTKTRPLYPRWESNLRFAFEITARAHSINFPINYSDNGWSSLQKALKVRHRLTHPKQLSDLDVSDDDLRQVDQGFEWFRKHFEGMSRAIAAAVATRDRKRTKGSRRRR